MNSNDYDTRPTDDPKAAESSAETQVAGSSDAREPNGLSDLEREALFLLKSGQNEPRLRQLLFALDAERPRQIDQALALLIERNPLRLLLLLESRTEMIKRIEPETKRIDLTIPEIFTLRKIIAQQMYQEQKLLLAGKKCIEQKDRPGIRNRHRTS